ncbi:response regulator transcription factor [Streptomyces sp. NPDC001634]|uniref:response regulator transcription factor n=1 Tax=Streptomyces sp. NPDC001634 TaxID=3154390 RepID=UPI003323AAE9
MSGTPASRSGRVRVLNVDDEPALTELLSVAVTEAGRRPCPALDGQTALRLARGCIPHAVVLDGMLPDLDGIQVLRRLRYEYPKLPVLMLTARDALEHRLDGLESGADDYVAKPFPLEEVVVRLRGLLHRAGAEETRADDSVRVIGDLVLAPKARKVHRDGTPIRLTVKGFDLLELLVYISGRRRKVDRGRAPMIHTVRGSGYAIRPVEEGR